MTFAVLLLVQASIGEIDPRVLPPDRKAPEAVLQATRELLRAANRKSSEDWRAIATREDWEAFRDRKIEALRRSLGTFPPAGDLRVRVTRKLEGDGYRIENLVFESRPGLVVTANLYLPAAPPPSMPGILLCHSHHNPKTQGELQDMGMIWARAGCAVLVMDQLGHGERRQHPFKDQSSYPKSFRAGRQDYYFRYNLGIQLHAVGESLVGWMAYDLMRGADVLLSRPGVDKGRVALLGAVAGGGDPAAVAAALDRRIAVAVPFNFGGPQPETTYPLPADAESAFNYAGGGSWESTRNLRLSARDGFLPWVIVGSIAPRGLVYAHEFSWDRERDPVWKRFERIYALTGRPDRLAAATGRGVLSGKPPEATHCNNIGLEHRKGIHPAFEKWLGIAPPRETQDRRPAEELLCLTPEISPKPLHEIAAALGRERREAARARGKMKEEWAELLGGVAAWEDAKPAVHGRTDGVVRISIEVEGRVELPLVLLLPNRKGGSRFPFVVAFAQQGKAALLKERAEALTALLDRGIAVAAVDLRGTGETDYSRGGRGRTSAATSHSSSELMLGRPLLGLRLRDLRAVLRYLRGREELDAARAALWGDSFAAPNPKERVVEVPWDADVPSQSEPMGAWVAVLAALYEDGLRAVYARGGVRGYASLLEGPFLYVPHDVVVPGALGAGDMEDLAALARAPLRREAWVDGLNRRVGDEGKGPLEAARWMAEELLK